MHQAALGHSQVPNNRKRSLGEEHESPYIKRNKTSPLLKKPPTAPKPKSGALGDITNVMSRASGVMSGRAGQRRERVTKLAEALGAKTMGEMATLQTEQESTRRIRMQEGRKPAYSVDDKDQVEKENDKQKRLKKEEPRGKVGKGKTDKEKAGKVKNDQNTEDLQEREKAKAIEAESKESKVEARLQ
ncbi:hypothetical protein BGZ96_006517, partial [Linnemannia gamsii]